MPTTNHEPTNRPRRVHGGHLGMNAINVNSDAIENVSFLDDHNGWAKTIALKMETEAWNDLGLEKHDIVLIDGIPPASFDVAVMAVMDYGNGFTRVVVEREDLEYKSHKDRKPRKETVVTVTQGEDERGNSRHIVYVEINGHSVVGYDRETGIQPAGEVRSVDGHWTAHTTMGDHHTHGVKAETVVAGVHHIVGHWLTVGLR